MSELTESLEQAADDYESFRDNVVDAAIEYIHNVEMGHYGPNAHRTKGSLISLHAAVTMYEESKL